MRKKLIMPQASVSLTDRLLWMAGCFVRQHRQAVLFPSPCGAGKLINTPCLCIHLLDGCLWGAQRLGSAWRGIAVVPGACRDVAAGVSGGDRLVGQDGGFSCVPASMGSLLAGAEPRLAECCFSVLPCTPVNDNEPAAQLISSVRGAACSVWEAELRVHFVQCADTWTFWSQAKCQCLGAQSTQNQSGCSSDGA